MLKNWPSYQILLGRSLKSSQHLNEDMKEYLRERKGLGKREETGFLLLWFKWDSDTAWQGAETGTKDNENNIGKLVLARVMFQPCCESTCYAHTCTDPPQHHRQLPHGPACTPPSILLTLCWHSSSVASSSSCSPPSLWLLILEPQFHLRS